MSYTKQNFTKGQTLKAEHLNNIENGILENETNVSKCATKEYVAEAIANAQLADGEVDLSTYATKDDLEDYQPKGNYLTEIPEEYVTDEELTKKGYLTEHQDISNLATKDDFNSKQDTLVSGTNIKTINGVSI